MLPLASITRGHSRDWTMADVTVSAATLGAAGWVVPAPDAPPRE